MGGFVGVACLNKMMSDTVQKKPGCTKKREVLYILLLEDYPATDSQTRSRRTIQFRTRR